MSGDDSARLTATAKSVLQKTGPLVRGRQGSPELRRYFRAAARVAQRVVEKDLASNGARHDVERFRLISQGVIAIGASVAREIEVQPDSHFPGMDRYLCMASCVAAYNKCKGRDGSDDDDEPQVETDEPDDGDEGDPIDLGCYLAYASCLSGCTPPMS